VCIFLWEKGKRGSVRTELLQAQSMDQQQQHEDDDDTLKCRDLAGLHKSLVQEAQVLHGLVCTIVASKGEAEPATFKKAEAIVSNFRMSLCLCLSLCLAFFFLFFWVSLPHFGFRVLSLGMVIHAAFHFIFLGVVAGSV
jgi:hypothetical protein